MIIGLTGGIGSGKTTVANAFAKYGVPVYIADLEAKNLMATSKALKAKIINAFGDEAYSNGIPNRSYLSKLVFNDPGKLNKLNSFVHPAVQRHFKKWLAKQTASYVIKEAAILFESGSYKDCDKIITVTAPLETRIQRVMQRDAVNYQDVLVRIKNQWPEEEKIKRSHFVIENISLEKTLKKVEEIHLKLLELSS